MRKKLLSFSLVFYFATYAAYQRLTWVGDRVVYTPPPVAIKNGQETTAPPANQPPVAVKPPTPASKPKPAVTPPAPTPKPTPPPAPTPAPPPRQNPIELRLYHCRII